MCTVSVIPLLQDRNPGIGRAIGFSLMCNRDELRSRPAAHPPRRLHAGDRHGLMPVDPPSGGTWIAVNDRGLAISLLNAYPGPQPAPPGRVSRGTIIPRLLQHDDTLAALRDLMTMNAAGFAPLHIVFIDRHRMLGSVTSDGHAFCEERVLPLHTPAMFTSSGLGDQRVRPPRSELFDELVRHDPSVARQLSFHRHRWQDRPHLSVCMARPEALTVSWTHIEVLPDRITLRYRGEAPDAPGASERYDLDPAW